MTRKIDRKQEGSENTAYISDGKGRTMAPRERKEKSRGLYTSKGPRASRFLIQLASRGGGGAPKHDRLKL
eukprot:1154147-Pelagomonas_calceolata.AAC.2